MCCQSDDSEADQIRSGRDNSHSNEGNDNQRDSNNECMSGQQLEDQPMRAEMQVITRHERSRGRIRESALEVLNSFVLIITTSTSDSEYDSVGMSVKRDFGIRHQTDSH